MPRRCSGPGRPYDRIEPNFQGGLKYRIELLPERDLPEGEFTVKVLDTSLKNSIDKKIRHRHRLQVHAVRADRSRDRG